MRASALTNLRPKPRLPRRQNPPHGAPKHTYYTGVVFGSPDEVNDVGHRSEKTSVPESNDAAQAATTHSRHLRKLRIAHLWVSLATALLLIVILTRPLGTTPQTPVLELSEERLKQEAARSGLGMGQRAPGFDGEDLALVGLDARPLSLGQFRGQSVWIVFWATYCEPCKQEEPDLVAAFEAHQSDGLVIVAIDVGEPLDEVRAYVRSHRLPYPIAIDVAGRARDAYGAIGTPTHYFIDVNGVVRDRAFGRLTRAEMERHLGSISP